MNTAIRSSARGGLVTIGFPSSEGVYPHSKVGTEEELETTCRRWR